MNKKLALTALLLGFSLGLLVLPSSGVKAEEATSTTSSGLVSGEEVDAIREAVMKKVAEKLKAIKQRRKKRGWIGVIEEKTAIGLTLKGRQKERSVVLYEEVQIIGPKREKLTFDDLEVGQRIIAMGYLQPDNTLEARRIVVLPEKEAKPKLQIVFGKIIDKSKEEEILVITPQQKPDQEYEVILTKKTILRQRQQNQLKKIDYDDLEAEQKVIALLAPVKTNQSTYQAKLILVLSPSPNPTPTPKGENEAKKSTQNP